MSNQVKKPSPGIRFQCKGGECRHSCCGPFSGVSRKLRSVDGRPFEEIVLTEEDCRALTEQGRADLIEEGYAASVGKPYRKMALEPSGACKAWVDGRCSVYDSRPTLCRAFPFYFDLFSGLCIIRCEGCSSDRRVTADAVLSEGDTPLTPYRDSIDSAKRMYEYWLRFYSDSDGGTP